jgi:hypothetical protein
MLMTNKARPIMMTKECEPLLMAENMFNNDKKHSVEERRMYTQEERDEKEMERRWSSREV